jgi:hypothetical protein
MTTSEYPDLIPVDGMSQNLSARQKRMAAIELTKKLHGTGALWFLGMSGTLIAQMLPEGAAKSYVYGATAFFFLCSAVTFFFATRNNNFANLHAFQPLRISLAQMGVSRPMKFMREHPLHMAAYEELKADLDALKDSEYLDMMFNRNHALAMLVFTGAERYKSGPVILSIVERGITKPLMVAEMLDESKGVTSTLADGIL